ncbi:MAG: hypothetical protein PHW39_02880 [Syntrophomonadaceae bacterium]|mgnify:CR=1 FL=1|jgi:hypothetical protein|nr:hypothetical protein [Clostridia bacterium]MDD4562006.1 hypothetical protein [Syntrophomonadaceae bacterium]
MNEIKKTVIEEGQGISGFLIPEQVLPSNLIDYFGLGAPFTMTVSGSMKKIEDTVFFEVEGWKLFKK